MTTWISFSRTNRIYLSNGPVDNRPPRIIATEQVMGGASAGPDVVRAAILDDMSSDRNFFASEIVLRYSVDGGAEQEISMRHSGGQIYRGEIPNVVGSNVEYSVAATDLAGNTGTGTQMSFMIGNATIFIDGFETGDVTEWSSTSN